MGIVYACFKLLKHIASFSCLYMFVDKNTHTHTHTHMNKHWKKFTLGNIKVQKAESELKYTYVAESPAKYKAESETQNLEFLTFYFL